MKKTHIPQIPHILIPPWSKCRIDVQKNPLRAPQPQTIPKKLDHVLEPLAGLDFVHGLLERRGGTNGLEADVDLRGAWV